MLIALLIGKLEIKDIKEYVRKYKEKIFKKRGSEDKDRGIGGENQSDVGKSCEGQG